MEKLGTIYEKITDYLINYKKIVIPVAYILLICVPFLGLGQYVMRVLCLIGIY